MQRAKIMLKSNLSEETLDAARCYLKQFLNRKHTIEHLNGAVEIYLRDPASVRLVKEHFPSLIAAVRPLS